MPKPHRNAGLDPETDYLEMGRNLALYDFPWDMNQALSLALFRTYAVPSVGRLLHDTGEFTERPQKRYDDTGLLLEAPITDGFDSERGRAAIRRINQMHRMYDISNDDMRYVLTTFVVVPKRWLDDFGWRRLTDDEVLASVRYYQALGRHLGIQGIPGDYDEFAQVMDDYEREHFAFDAGARAVADSTLRLMTTFYPRPVRPFAALFARGVMDRPLLAAFGYDDPGPLVRLLARTSLKARAKVVARMPARRTPKHVIDLPWVRSYPDGYDVTELGTFAPGCPVQHRAEQPRADEHRAEQHRAS
ncbi:oxygenase MpaB family protein [Nocardioides limicola]|uniref:oxygenase MpaB family protein n=1 Tax=Nocardioides limicola TaxID=2803368 RepID=UPI00193B5508|nr:oxygenase MpaB family protein [Nocardioides sp. DJM-14]